MPFLLDVNEEMGLGLRISAYAGFCYIAVVLSRSIREFYTAHWLDLLFKLADLTGNQVLSFFLFF